MKTARPDTLVLMLTPGASLEAWLRCGILHRELALPIALAQHYERVIVVSFGDASDQARLVEYCLTHPEPHVQRVSIITNDKGVSLEAYTRELPNVLAARLRAGLTGQRGAQHPDEPRIVLRTTQMVEGTVAARLSAGLRDRGVGVALVARGGYLWTRQLAATFGTDAPQTIQAAREEGALCCGADIVVGSTLAMAKDLAWRYGLDAARTRVVPNFVAPVPASDIETRDGNRIVCSGALLPRKRVDVLIRAVASVAVFHENVVLEVYGDGPQRPHLEQLAQQLAAPVVFHAHHTEQQRISALQSCGVYAVASEMEGHPKSVLEAMACGCSVVVADSPGLGGVVQHGVTGIRCDGTPEGFALVMQQMVEDPEWRSVIGPAAAAAVREQYALTRVVELELAAHADAAAFAFADQPEGRVANSTGTGLPPSSQAA